MTTLAQPPRVVRQSTSYAQPDKGRLFVKWITSTDHKTIGYLYLITSFSWFLIAGILALFMRAELYAPGLQFWSNEQYNQMFTMHG
ncbi:MAG: cbb3-type cytochrome c oxidase subunit I, partial [Actinobacteria bacterium]|nr:cbb3-type cytochrome c oxidase subunit I [Actinomycetota bacterium]